MIAEHSGNREARYGYPGADQILVNRFYTVGYSYYFRQAKWALEIVDPDKKDLTPVERLNNFRPDFRIPKRFRGDLSDYEGSGFDRGHLVASANLNDEELQNSETFLLSNMSPQTPALNRNRWRELESAVRRLDARADVLETYVISGPLFDFADAIFLIGNRDDNGVEIPIPSHFFKCVLAEKRNGRLHMWAFEMLNGGRNQSLEKCRVSTSYVERRAGVNLWDNLTGPEMETERNRIRAMW